MPTHHSPAQRGASRLTESQLPETSMYSFQLYAVGHLAHNPELVPARNGSTAHARFCLIGVDYVGKEEGGHPREQITRVWFVAFGALGEAVARHGHKGDQLIVQARVRNNSRKDPGGSWRYEHSYIVEALRFGAPRRARRESQVSHEA